MPAESPPRASHDQLLRQRLPGDDHRAHGDRHDNPRRHRLQPDEGHRRRTSPSGQRVGSLEFSWQWPDNPPTPVKFRVFTQYLPLRVEEAGVHTLGL